MSSRPAKRLQIVQRAAISELCYHKYKFYHEYEIIGDQANKRTNIDYSKTLNTHTQLSKHTDMMVEQQTATTPLQSLLDQHESQGERIDSSDPPRPNKAAQECQQTYFKDKRLPLYTYFHETRPNIHETRPNIRRQRITST